MHCNMNGSYKVKNHSYKRKYVSSAQKDVQLLEHFGRIYPTPAHHNSEVFATLLPSGSYCDASQHSNSLSLCFWLQPCWISFLALRNRWKQFYGTHRKSFVEEEEKISTAVYDRRDMTALLSTYGGAGVRSFITTGSVWDNRQQTPPPPPTHPIFCLSLSWSNIK